MHRHTATVVARGIGASVVYRTRDGYRVVGRGQDGERIEHYPSGWDVLGRWDGVPVPVSRRDRLECLLDRISRRIGWGRGRWDVSIMRDRYGRISDARWSS